MTTNRHKWIEGLFRTLAEAERDDPAERRKLEMPPEFLAFFKTAVQRSGVLLGHGCIIRRGPGNTFQAIGLSPGDKVIEGLRPVDQEEDADAMDSVRAAKSVVGYELRDAGTIDFAGDGRLLSVHTVVGMDSDDKADQFFNPEFFRGWREVAPKPISRSKSGAAKDVTTVTLTRDAAKTV